MVQKRGWKSIPLSLKIIFVLTILWMIGSLMAIPMRFADGLPFFGLTIAGIGAALILIILDLIGPLIFLIGTWNAKKYGYYCAIGYMGIFILNSIVALITVHQELVVMPILIPALVYVVFLIFIVRRKSHFS